MHIAYLRSTQNNFKDAYFLMGGRPIFLLACSFSLAGFPTGLWYKRIRRSLPFIAAQKLSFSVIQAMKSEEFVINCITAWPAKIMDFGHPLEVTKVPSAFQYNVHLQPATPLDA